MLPLAFALTVAATCSAPPTPATSIRGASPKQAYAESYAANDLYSRQARRRMAHYLRLRLMELNAKRLERVEKVVRGSLSIDGLLREP